MSTQQTLDTSAKLEDAASSSVAREVRGRTRRRRWLWLVVALGLLLWCSPWIVAQTRLRALVLDAVLPRFAGHVQVGQLELGWFAPVTVVDVEVFDADGQRLVAIPRIRLERPLWQLLRDGQRLGHIHLDHPDVTCIWDEQGGNLLRTLASVETQADGPPLRARIVVEHARFALLSEQGQTLLETEDASLTAAVNESPGRNLVAAGHVSCRDGANGRARLDFEARSLDGPGQLLSLTFDADDYHLKTLKPVLTELTDVTALDGVLDGQLKIQISDAASAPPLIASGELRTHDLLLATGAMAAGERLELPVVELTASVQGRAGELEMRELTLTSAPLEVTARGTVRLDSGTAQSALRSETPAHSDAWIEQSLSHSDLQLDGTVDVAALSRMLHQTLRLHPDVRLKQGHVAFAATSTSTGHSAVDAPTWTATLKVEDLVAENQERTFRWESPLDFRFQAHRADGRLAIDECRCESDFLTIAAQGDSSRGTVTAACDLTQLTGRLEQFVELSDFELAGTLAAKLAYERLENRNLRFGGRTFVRNVRLTLPQGGVIREPELVLQGVLEADLAARRVHRAECQMTAGSDRCTATLTEAVVFQKAVSSWPVRLELNGHWPVWRARLIAALGLRQRRPAAETAGSEMESAAEVSLVLDGRYVLGSDVLHVGVLEITSPAVQMRSMGTITHVTDDRQVEFTGALAYDWQKLLAQLPSSVRRSLVLTGAGKSNFAIRGPLDPAGDGTVSRELQGKMGLGWSGGRLHGLSLGPGRIDGRLEDRRVTFEPVEFSVETGHVRLLPTVELTEADPVLRLAEGSGAEEFHATPELCREWLGYTAPLLARATEVEGKFSVRLDGATIPLQRLAEADVGGTLHVEECQLRSSAMTRELTGLVRQINTLVQRGSGSGSSGAGSWIELPWQDVPFRMVHQRVHHHDLRILVGDVTVWTSGWVGLDDQIALIAAIPIPDAWLDGKRLLSGLRGQTLQVPIRGSLQQPQVDRRAVADLTRQLGRRALEGAVEDELSRQLNRLFQN